ncbi:hypothetical protein GGG16DRAFT_43277 [Schizophyllum commune]
MKAPTAPPPPVARSPSSSGSDADPMPGSTIRHAAPLTFMPSENMHKGTIHAVNTLVGSRRSWKTMPQGKEPVWPPQLEAALVEGLDKYRPGSTMETRHLRRFPKRNRYISDFILHTTGKYRTPKQVGSRLQQLRDTCHDPRILHLVQRKEYPPLEPNDPQNPPLSSLLPPIPPMAVSLPRKGPQVASSPPSTQPNPSFVGGEQSANDRTWRVRESTSDNQQQAPYLPMSPHETGPSQSVLDLGIDPSAVRHEQAPEAAPKKEEAEAAPPQIRRSTICVEMAFRVSPVVLTSPTYGVVGLQGTRASDLERLGGPLDEIEHYVKAEAPKDMATNGPEVSFISPWAPKSWCSRFTVYIDGTDVHREEVEVYPKAEPANMYMSYLVPSYWAVLCHHYDLHRCIILQDIVDRDTGRVICGMRYIFRDTNALPPPPAPTNIEQWRQSTVAGAPYEPPYPPSQELPPAQTMPPAYTQTWTQSQLPPGWPEDKVYHSSYSVRQPQPQHAKGAFLTEYNAPPSPPDNWQAGSTEAYQQGAEAQTPVDPAAAYASPYPSSPGHFPDFPAAPPPSWAYADPTQSQQWGQ